ncbi:MAG: DUF2950 domain-containing protein [Pseudomonas sp.]
MSSLPRTLLIVAGLAWPTLAAAQAQQTFPTPETAAQALVDALGTEHADQAKLSALLGANWHSLITLEGVARKDVDAFLKQYQQHHAIETPSADKAVLTVGDKAWAFPVPLAKTANGWHFDTKAGAEEMRVRRIGRNELAAVQSELAYHDAQMDYAEVDHDGDGVLEYAQKIFSSDGQHDGLYWADDDSSEISPLGPLFGDATLGGDWHGYHFHILEAQGPSAPGGAYSYRLGDSMSRGFALIGWPAKYADSGVMSFMISHEGQVFEKDLGPSGEKLARAMKNFDPDDSWKAVPAVQEGNPP